MGTRMGFHVPASLPIFSPDHCRRSPPEGEQSGHLFAQLIFRMDIHWVDRCADLGAERGQAADYNCKQFHSAAATFSLVA